MEAVVIKKQPAFRFETDVLSRLKVAAKNENKSVNNKTPNATTIAAIEEARAGTSTGRIDMSSFEAFMKSHEE